LYALQVNFGDKGMRQILAGLALFHTPEYLRNKQVVFVFNLKPRAMAGLQSQGMLLTTKDAQGVPHPVTAPTVVPNGTRLQ
jgi:methionyl-tRNA synthetase